MKPKMCMKRLPKTLVVISIMWPLVLGVCLLSLVMPIKDQPRARN